MPGQAIAELVLPPVEIAPVAIREAIRSYSSCSISRGDLIDAVDRAGYEWERSNALRIVELESRFRSSVDDLRRIHDELVLQRAAADWLRGFPARTNWQLQPYPVVTDALEALGLIVFADRRTQELTRAPAIDMVRHRYAPAQASLAAAGCTVNDVALAMEAKPSTVQDWLSGRHPVPDELVEILEMLIGEADAQRTLDLIPGHGRRSLAAALELL